MNQNRSALKSKIIYDFGANNGDDVGYYLRKGDVIVAVEANPILADEIKRRFSKEVADKRLFVINCVLTIDEQENEVPFYVHKCNHVLSRFPRPSDEELINFTTMLLPSINVINLISAYGEPHYIKIDIEHYDAVILKELFLHNIKPPFLSAEAHHIEVFSHLVSLGEYNSFNLVDGMSVENKYRHHRIKTANGDEVYSFPFHSAGPFGEDIIGNWMVADQFVKYLAFEGLGWKDIHASNCISADPTCGISLRPYLLRAVRGKVSSMIGWPWGVPKTPANIHEAGGAHL